MYRKTKMCTNYIKANSLFFLFKANLNFKNYYKTNNPETFSKINSIISN